MTDINETPSWEATISLISRSERVEGGQDGPANRATRQLANRTLFLKEKSEAMDDDLSAKVGVIATFEEGATLASSRDEIMYGKYRMVWTGEFPKTVPVNSTPESSGGIGAGKWAYTSDAVLRDEYAGLTGASYLGYSINMALSGRTVAAKLNNLVFVEDFKERVSEDGDWQPAAQAAHDYALANGFNKVWSFRPMQFKSPLIVDGWGQALDLRLSKVSAHDAFPPFADWKASSALITIGTANGGSMVGLNIDIGFMDGKNLCSGVEVTGRGCGGSRINIDRAYRCNIVYDCHQQTWPAASNFISGKYWYNGNMGAFFARGADGSTPIAEGHKPCVGFVTGMRYGGYLLRNGAQYAQISGDADFNGRYLSEVTISGTSFSGLNRGAAISNGTTTGEILAFYAQTSGVFKVLIIESRDVSGGNSSFAVGDTLTSGSWSSTVSVVRTAQQGENFFFDVILDFYGSAFAKVDISCGYLGGVVGHSLHSCTINYKNSYSAYTNSINGACFVHSGTILTLRDTYLNRVVFDCTADYIAPGTSLFTRGNRVYGGEYAATFAPASEKTIRTFTYLGSTNAPGVKDIYEVQVFGPTGLSGVCSKFMVAVSPSGLEIYDSTIKNVSKLSLTADGLSLKARQDSPNTFIIYFTFNRK